MTQQADAHTDLAHLRRLLQERAEALWGPERRPALDAALETATEAIWRIRQEPLALEDAEP